MTKPDWKTKPHERKRMTLQQENAELKRRIENVLYELEDAARTARHYRQQADTHQEAAARYEVLRTKDVMVLDGEPKYLKGEDLDAYCDVEKEKFWGVGLPSMRGRGVTAQMMQAVVDELQEKRNGNDTGSESKKTDTQDSGHHTDILRYADWYGLWKQRRT